MPRLLKLTRQPNNRAITEFFHSDSQNNKRKAEEGKENSGQNNVSRNIAAVKIAKKKSMQHAKSSTVGDKSIPQNPQANIIIDDFEPLPKKLKRLHHRYQDENEKDNPASEVQQVVQILDAVGNDSPSNSQDSVGSILDNSVPKISVLKRSYDKSEEAEKNLKENITNLVTAIKKRDIKTVQKLIKQGADINARYLEEVVELSPSQDTEDEMDIEEENRFINNKVREDSSESDNDKIVDERGKESAEEGHAENTGYYESLESSVRKKKYPIFQAIENYFEDCTEEQKQTDIEIINLLITERANLEVKSRSLSLGDSMPIEYILWERGDDNLFDIFWKKSRAIKVKNEKLILKLIKDSLYMAEPDIFRRILSACDKKESARCKDYIKSLSLKKMIDEHARWFYLGKDIIISSCAIIKMLITEYGVDINSDNASALQFAVKQYEPEVVKLLLDLKADVKKAGGYKYLLNYCVEKNKIEVFKLLAKSCNHKEIEKTVLERHGIAKFIDADEIEWLKLCHKAGINLAAPLKNAEYDSAQHMAIKKKRHEIAKYLLTIDVPVSVQDKKGQKLLINTPTHDLQDTNTPINLQDADINDSIYSDSENEEREESVSEYENSEGSEPASEDFSEYEESSQSLEESATPELPELSSTHESSEEEQDENKQKHSVDDEYLVRVTDTLRELSKNVGEVKDLVHEFKKYKKQWGYTGKYEFVDPMTTNCRLCDHPHVGTLFKIKNIYTSEKVKTGSECIKQFRVLDKANNSLLDKKFSKETIEQAVQDTQKERKQAREAGEYFLANRR